jgi:hypothetical protein
MSRPVRLLAAVLVLFAAACSSKSKAARPMDPPTYVSVENQSFSDMNVYVLRNSQRIRLGTVTGNTTRQLQIPANMVFGATTLAFLADPIGGTRTPISQEITVQPGDVVRLVIPPNAR